MGRYLKLNFADISRFVLISALIFSSLFLLLYGAVYYEVFAYRFKESIGIEMNSALEGHNDIVIKDGLIQVDKSMPSNNIDLVDFHMAITPPDNRMIMAQIDKSMPIVEVPAENLVKGDSEAFEKDIMLGLEKGIVRYPLTAEPGEEGNVVLTGHSSFYTWKPGDFKDAFASMHNVHIGDKITIYYNQQKYVYEVFEEKVVSPDELSVLDQVKDQHWLTTITCTPIGTNTSRLIHIAKQIYPVLEK